MIIEGTGTLFPLKPLGIKPMEPTNLEKQNLEAHVDLCAERYKNIDQRLQTIEVKERPIVTGKQIGRAHV